MRWYELLFLVVVSLSSRQAIKLIIDIFDANHLETHTGLADPRPRPIRWRRKEPFQTELSQDSVNWFDNDAS